MAMLVYSVYEMQSIAQWRQLAQTLSEIAWDQQKASCCLPQECALRLFDLCAISTNTTQQDTDQG